MSGNACSKRRGGGTLGCELAPLGALAEHVAISAPLSFEDGSRVIAEASKGRSGTAAISRSGGMTASSLVADAHAGGGGGGMMPPCTLSKNPL